MRLSISSVMLDYWVRFYFRVAHILQISLIVFVNVNAEYGMSEEISSKGDVYSFGVLLLQMITGQSPTDKNFSDGASLHEFVSRAFPDNICDVIDQTMLEDDSNAQEVIKNCVIPLVRIGLSCSMTSPNERPDMGQVSTEILRIKPVASRMYVR